MPRRGIASNGAAVSDAKIVVNPPQLLKTCGKVNSSKAA
jgi:hypothetical protein